eukprot:CAMPEP_0114488926 /NCGR_PEP_ID=MMETSP0109-20121206/1601_1 /TAXON_ID=29199 /ORGANISM="Chlorarachnion reptans, Strain CCCM449" /LENGTH=111 /DNA_ID=CAMNT_0001665373 /DNA_START=963 /DNA_END=1295 /DNA_ORIENTATION=-
MILRDLPLPVLPRRSHHGLNQRALRPYRHARGDHLPANLHLLERVHRLVQTVKPQLLDQVLQALPRLDELGHLPRHRLLVRVEGPLEAPGGLAQGLGGVPNDAGGDRGVLA